MVKVTPFSSQLIVRSMRCFKLCCNGSAVLSIDITFNLGELWLTYSSFRNKNLINNNANGNHPIFLGPCFFHFKKDESIFCRFFMEMIAIDPRLKNIKKIGPDMEMAIYNGISAISEKLELLICVFHLKSL